MSMDRGKAEEILRAAGLSDFVEEANEANAAALQKHNEETIEAAMDYFAAFTSVSGAVVLEKLKDQTTRISTMNKAACINDGDIPLNPAEFMAFREGQNSIIRHIQDMIILATKKEDE